MMLTSDTAEAMGIADRSNPAQSISAGARYFASVHEKVAVASNVPVELQRSATWVPVFNGPL